MKSNTVKLRRNSIAYKSLVGDIISTYRLAKRIRLARNESVIAGYKAEGKKKLKKIEQFYNTGEHPRLDAAAKALRSLLRSV